MPDMRELLAQRAERAENDTFEAKHAKSMAALNAQLKPKIDALRLIGPAKPQMREEHRKFVSERTGMGYCQFCDPPPKVLTCPKCDWETTERWRMKLHNIIGPQWCQDRADKKARKWAQHA